MAERGHPLKKFAPRLIAEAVVIFASIVDYHEERIAYLDDLRATMRETADRATLAVEPFIQRARANSPSWEITGLHELGRLNSDREVVGSLVSAAAARDWLRIRIEDLFLPENARLHQVILTYLGDRR